MNKALLLSLWNRALEEEIGIKFKVNGVERHVFATRMYDARKGLPELEALILFQPNNDFIYIAKKAVELEI